MTGCQDAQVPEGRTASRFRFKQSPPVSRLHQELRQHFRWDGSLAACLLELGNDCL